MAEPVLRPLNPQAIGHIHEATIDLLERVGVEMPSSTAQEALRRYGCAVEGSRVRFPWPVVEKALATVPRSFRLTARRAERSVVIGAGEPVFGMAYGSAFVTDRLRGRRLGTFQDYCELMRLTQALPNIQVASFLPCDPADLPRPTRHLDLFLAELTLTDKPLMGPHETAEALADCLVMAGMVFGREELRRTPTLLGLVNIARPLRWEPAALEVISAYAAAGQPVVVASYTMGGVSAPVTLAGMLLQSNAEVLSGVVLTQAVREGTPVVYGTSSAPFDLSTAHMALGSPEAALLAAAQVQLGRSYGIPCRAGGSLTDAKEFDPQAGSEGMLLGLSSLGADFVLQAAGILESYQTVSYEKLVWDDEVLGGLRRLARGIAVDAAHLAAEVIAAQLDSASYLEADHTLTYFRDELRQVALADRRPYSEWWARGRQTSVDQATVRWRTLLESDAAEATPLGTELKRELQAFVASRRRASLNTSSIRADFRDAASPRER